MDRYGMGFLAPPTKVKRVIYQIYHPLHLHLLQIFIITIACNTWVTSHHMSSISHHHYPGMNNTGDDKNACDDVEGWPERRASHGKV